MSQVLPYQKDLPTGIASEDEALREHESPAPAPVLCLCLLCLGVEAGTCPDAAPRTMVCAPKPASLEVVRLKYIFKSVLNQDLRVFLGGDFFSKALCRAVCSYHMNNRDIGLLVLEMPSSFSYAEESFY